MSLLFDIINYDEIDNLKNKLEKTNINLNIKNIYSETSFIWLMNMKQGLQLLIKNTRLDINTSDNDGKKTHFHLTNINPTNKYNTIHFLLLIII